MYGTSRGKTSVSNFQELLGYFFVAITAMSTQTRSNCYF